MSNCIYLPASGWANAPLGIYLEISHSSFPGIARTNVLPLGCDAREGGLFLEASRINHSCRQHAQNTWNANIGRLTIHALRDIEEGQEITITYLGDEAEYAERQQSLHDKFFFNCKCDLCSLPPAQREESDRTLGMIKFIDTAIGIFNEMIRRLREWAASGS